MTKKRKRSTTHGQPLTADKVVVAIDDIVLVAAHLIDVRPLELTDDSVVFVTLPEQFSNASAMQEASKQFSAWWRFNERKGRIFPLPFGCSVTVAQGVVGEPRPVRMPDTPDV